MTERLSNKQQMTGEEAGRRKKKLRVKEAPGRERGREGGTTARYDSLKVISSFPAAVTQSNKMLIVPVV